MSLETRNCFSLWVSIGAGVAAVLCLAYGLWGKDARKKSKGRVLVALWMLLTPLWFWVDWVFLREPLGQQGREELKHTHELARNIWIAYVLVLGALYRVFDLKPGG